MPLDQTLVVSRSIDSLTDILQRANLTLNLIKLEQRENETVEQGYNKACSQLNLIDISHLTIKTGMELFPILEGWQEMGGLKMSEAAQEEIQFLRKRLHEVQAELDLYKDFLTKLKSSLTEILNTGTIHEDAKRVPECDGGTQGLLQEPFRN